MAVGSQGKRDKIEQTTAEQNTAEQNTIEFHTAEQLLGESGAGYTYRLDENYELEIHREEGKVCVEILCDGARKAVFYKAPEEAQGFCNELLAGCRKLKKQDQAKRVVGSVAGILLLLVNLFFLFLVWIPYDPQTPVTAYVLLSLVFGGLALAGVGLLAAVKRWHKDRWVMRRSNLSPKEGTQGVSK